MKIKSTLAFAQTSVGWEANIPDHWKMFVLSGNVEHVMEDDTITVEPNKKCGDTVEIYPLHAEYDPDIDVTRIWYQ